MLTAMSACGPACAREVLAKIDFESKNIESLAKRRSKVVHHSLTVLCYNKNKNCGFLGVFNGRAHVLRPLPAVLPRVGQRRDHQGNRGEKGGSHIGEKKN